MTERWYQEKKREGYYRMAKREGYRARSAYKLQQIQSKFHVVRSGDTVVDLGASPGGWSQVAVEVAGPTGRVIGVDLSSVRPMEGATFVRGDLARPETVEQVLHVLTAGGGRPAVNVVLSDMSPNLSGQYSRDQAESVYLCGKALEFAQRVLDSGGNLVAKVFEGEDYPGFRSRVEALFDFVKPYRPAASRRQSSEVYLVAKGLRGGSLRS